MTAARKSKDKMKRKPEVTTSGARADGGGERPQRRRETWRRPRANCWRPPGGLLETQGSSSLTLKAIGREAGQNESLIGYHFGSKTGLMVALVDWLLYDTLRDLQARVARLAEGRGPAARSRRRLEEAHR